MPLKRSRDEVSAASSRRERIADKLYDQKIALDDVPKDLWKDREFVVNAISIDPDAFKYASEELQRDRDVALSLVQESPGALDLVSDELRSDGKIILAAMDADYMNDDPWIHLEQISGNLSEDRNFGGCPTYCVHSLLH